MRVIGYVRVSSRRVEDQEESRPAQEAAIGAWCRRHGHRLVDTLYDEGESGTLDSEHRPGLKEALARIAAKDADGLVVRELDRLSRDVMVQEKTLAELWALRPATEIMSTRPDEQQNCSRTTDPDDWQRKYLRRQLGLVAEMVRDLTVARMRAGKRRKRAAGGFIGGQVPYGFQAVDGDLVPDPAEQAAVRRIRRLHQDGRSLREIVATLEAEGVPAKRGGDWHPATVARVLEGQP